MTSLTKILTPQAKHFVFSPSYKTFETLTGSVALTGPEKFPRKAMCVSVFFSQKSTKAAGCQSVKLVFVPMFTYGHEPW